MALALYSVPWQSVVNLWQSVFLLIARESPLICVFKHGIVTPSFILFLSCRFMWV